LSLRQLASQGVSFTYLSRIESGTRAPSVQVIRKLARKLGVSPQYLETGIELTTREELELALTDAELKIRLEPQDKRVDRDFRAIIKLAEREGELDISARARAALGMGAAGWGRFSEARDLLEVAVQHPTLAPSASPDVHTALVRVYYQLGHSDDAVSLCERILSTAHPDDAALRTLVSTYMSEALSDLGDFRRAEQVIRDYAGDLENVDPYARARMHWVLAGMAVAQDERRLALRHMRSAIALLKGTEDTVRLARAHVMCGLILLWGGKTPAAGRHVNAAAGLLPSHAHATDRCRLLSLQALFAARQERFDDARMLADEALALQHEDEWRDQGVVLYAKALAEAAAGAAAAAATSYVKAIEALEHIGLWREASIVARDLAQAWHGWGDQGAVEKWSRRADELESRIGSKAAEVQDT
jgi:transcriptional regulator with XRE-family HTH domain